MSGAGRIAAGLLATWLVTAAAWAAEAPKNVRCAQRFGIEGIVPGLTAQAVRKALGRGESVADPETGVVDPAVWAYPKLDGLTVRFDGAVQASREVRAVEVRLPWNGADGALSERVRGALVRLGEPTIGARTPIDLVEHGPVLWYDPACGVVATAFRQPGPWWDPAVPSLFLKVETEARARATPPADRLLPPPGTPPSQAPDRP